MKLFAVMCVLCACCLAIAQAPRPGIIYRPGNDQQVQPALFKKVTTFTKMFGSKIDLDLDAIAALDNNNEEVSSGFGLTFWFDLAEQLRAWLTAGLMISKWDSEALKRPSFVIGFGFSF